MPADLTLMVMPDHRVWIDADSMIAYLRYLERQGADHALKARDIGNTSSFIGAVAVKDALGQVADSVVLTSMEAREEVGSRHVARRNTVESD